MSENELDLNFNLSSGNDTEFLGFMNENETNSNEMVEVGPVHSTPAYVDEQEGLMNALLEVPKDREDDDNSSVASRPSENANELNVNDNIGLASINNTLVQIMNSMNAMQNNMTLQITQVKEHTDEQINRVIEQNAQTHIKINQVQNEVVSIKEELQGNINRAVSRIETLENKLASFELDVMSKNQTITTKIDNLVKDTNEKFTLVNQERNSFELRFAETRDDVRVLEKGLADSKTALRKEFNRDLAKVVDKTKQNMNNIVDVINKNSLNYESRFKGLNEKLETVKELAETKQTHTHEHTDIECINCLDLCNMTKQSIDSINSKLQDEARDKNEKLSKLNQDLELKYKDLENKHKVLESKLSRPYAEVSTVPLTNQVRIEAELYLINFFPNKSEPHPVYFLKLAQKYVDVTSGPWENKLLQIIKHLQGDSGIWARKQMSLWENFQQFSSSFKRRYWSMGDQQLFVSKLMGEGNYNEKTDNLTSYIMDLYHVTQYLDQKIDTNVFLAYVSRHVPPMLRSTIATASGINSAESLEAFLSQLMETRKASKTNEHSKENQPNYNRSNPFNNRNNNQFFQGNYNKDNRSNNQDYNRNGPYQPYHKNRGNTEERERQVKFTAVNQNSNGNRDSDRCRDNRRYDRPRENPHRGGEVTSTNSQNYHPSNGRSYQPGYNDKSN